MRAQYFAKAPPDVIASEIMAKFSEYEKWLDKSGLRHKIQELYSGFYNFDKAGGFKLTKNADGSITRVSVNHFKNLVQRLHSLTTQSKLAFTPRATNSDAKSQLQSDFAKGLLEYYATEKSLNNVLSDSVLMSLIMLESFIYSPWNFNLGDEIAAQPNDQGMIDPNAEIVRSGDQEYHVLSALDCARSTTLKETPYYIIRQRVNRWDLAAQNPTFEQEILNSSIETKPESRLYTPFDTDATGQTDDDVTHIYTLIHNKTSAVPKGRVTVICGGKVLSDKTMFYKSMPVSRMSSGEIFETVVGDSPATSLLGLQQAIDALSTATLSNNLNFAMQNIWSPTAIDIQSISQGQNLVISAQKPEALQLTESSKETYNQIDNLKNDQQLLSGINATTRGNPDASIKTAGGQALALAQAVQFVDSIQKNYAKVAGDVGTITIHNLQEFCSVPRLAYLGGQSRASYVKEFTAEDVAAVDRVSVDLGSPLIQNVSGRYQMMQEWTQQGMVTDPKIALNFLRTGEMDSATEDDFKDKILIREENEQIRKGVLPTVIAFDIHPEHIIRHKAMAADPAIRENPEVLQVLLDHIQHHLDQQKMLDPDLAAILGLQPLPSQSMPMGPPPGPEIQGQPLPNTPEGTPPQVEQGLQEQQANLPPTPEPNV